MAAIEYYGTGRRKTSTARVFLRPGKGVITINHREFDKFFTTDALRTQVRRPLLLTETGERFDILATVDGGGINGQAGAVYAGNPGTASLAHSNSTASVSQYDTACVRLSHPPKS